MTRTLEKCTAIRHGSSATKDRRGCGFLREGLGLRFVHACSACKLCNLLTTLLMTYLFSFVDLLLLVIIRWFLLPLLPTLKLITSKRQSYGVQAPVMHNSRFKVFLIQAPPIQARAVQTHFKRWRFRPPYHPNEFRLIRNLGRPTTSTALWTLKVRAVRVSRAEGVLWLRGVGFEVWKCVWGLQP